MKSKTFWQVDAFTAQPYCGNPAAIVFEADDLSVEIMQAISREMNLSETVFVMAPEDVAADYGVRIFTPRNELPFAGHPTLATAYAMLESHRLPHAPIPRILKQECGMGIVPIEVTRTADGPYLVMTQGVPVYHPAEVDPQTLSQMLGCAENALADSPVELVSTGVAWMIVPLTSMASVAAVNPDLSLIERVCREQGAVGVTVFSLEAADPECSAKLRTFAPGEGISEDPVCGSGNGSVAAYIGKHGLIDGDDVTYYAEQGMEISRPGKVLASFARGPGGQLTIRVGGQAVKVIEGELCV